MEELVLEFGGDTVRAMHTDKFDLGFLGSKTVTRQTDILFNPTTQRWDVYYIENEGPTQGMKYLADGCTGFPEYEKARAHEVRWLNHCRERGVHPMSITGVEISMRVRRAP